MSHFTVLVAADSEEQLDARLLPYHEYECTGIEDYVVWVDEHDDVVQEYQNHREEYPTLDAFAEDWYGYSKDRHGRYGRRTNPNAKWDWWVIGGRWANMLPLTWANHPVDNAAKRNIDWSCLKSKQLDRHMSYYVAYHEAWNQVQQEVFPYGIDHAPLDKDYYEQGDRGEKRRECFPTFQHYVQHHRIQQISGEKGIRFDFMTFSELHFLRAFSPEQYQGRFYNEAVTHAYIGLDGQWREDSEMGWWGITFNKNNTYDQQFWEWIDLLPEDQVLYVVDCHI